MSSRLDYANCLLYWLLSPLVWVLSNAVSRVVFCRRKSEYVSQILTPLHWIPLVSRIELKLLLLTCKALRRLAPVYLKELCSMTSQSATFLCDHQASIFWKNNRMQCQRAFSVAAPRSQKKTSPDSLWCPEPGPMGELVTVDFRYFARQKSQQQNNRISGDAEGRQTYVLIIARLCW